MGHSTTTERAVWLPVPIKLTLVLCANAVEYSLWNWHDSFEHKISTVWALTDFDEAVGATRIVIGSHAWPVGDYLNRATNIG